MNKNLIALFIITSLFFIEAKAQLKLDFESGKQNIEEGNCWKFSRVNYSNIEFRIAGFWSGRTEKITGSLVLEDWIKTPWILPGSGNITMKARLENDGGTSRGVVFSYIAYDPAKASPDKEGDPVTFYTYSFPLPHSIDIRSISAEIPTAIKNSSLPYKIRISFIGTAGNSRTFSDDIVIPGTYASNPINNCLPVSFVIDADEDGVADGEDDYPNDAYKAYNNYYPSSTSAGTLAFEDAWPSKGDYDFNDLVVDYRINTVTNADNMVVEMIGDYTLKASGASYKNGFGFQLDGISPDKIKRVEGNSVEQASIYTMAANGLESGQTYANCIVFENFYKLMPWPGVGIGINTDKSAPTVPLRTLTVKLVFIENGQAATGGKVALSELPANKFNFYIVTKLQRGNEIHLADHVPSNKADASLFGTLSDDSNPSAGKYYKTENNLPWGINILQGFVHTIEKKTINEGYLHFVEWAASAGTTYGDWHLNLPGYLDNSKIY